MHDAGRQDQSELNLDMNTNETRCASRFLQNKGMLQPLFLNCQPTDSCNCQHQPCFLTKTKIQKSGPLLERPTR